MASAIIRVSVELLDRINRCADERGVTAAALIEDLLDREERRNSDSQDQRMRAIGAALRSADAEYWDEVSAWEVTSMPYIEED